MKWEYVIFIADWRVGPLDEQLNMFGRDGWEIFASESTGKTTRLYHAKRPVDAAAANLRIDLGQPADKPKE